MSVFYAELFGAIHAVAPDARFIHLAWPPVAGAVLMALEEVVRPGGTGIDDATAERVRISLGDWDKRQ